VTDEDRYKLIKLDPSRTSVVKIKKGFDLIVKTNSGIFELKYD